ncbi:MAG TPA: dihydrolipoamide acetyltransferase family protein [Candidatus Binataceae bacterium]|nr:dihydrolipoamide acetyltransferase family protein [Candidatus Binataceae bacterium]
MSIDVTMPQMGESVVEGTILKWLIKEGDVVTEDQPLVEISTDKVDTEIPSPGAGRIAKIVAREGETLPVGAKLAEIEPAGAAKAPAAPMRAEAPAPKPAEPGAQPKPPLSVVPKPQPQPARAAGAVEESVPRVQVSAAPASDHRRYSPVVLKIAAEQNIDLARVPGTGIGGRVSKRDVEKYMANLRKDGAPAEHAVSSAGAAQAAVAQRPAVAAAQPASRPAAAAAGAYNPPIYQPHEGDVIEPFTRRRKLIAEHMVYSKTHSPHVGTVAEVDLTRATRFRAEHKDDFQRREGFALTMLPLAAYATVRALKEFPRMNVSVAGDSVILRKQINLGIAMDTDEGLLVPVIKAAEGMSLTGIAREMENLRRKIAEKKITADDLAGGSFTLSNPGREGNLYGFAIINQPQVGILRMGEVKKRPVVIEVDGADAIVIRTMMYLALSYDHRVVDGVLGNRFLYRTAKILEEADFEF